MPIIPSSYYVNAHTVAVVMTMANQATLLPGGIKRGVAPEGTLYPYAQMSHIAGNDRLTLGRGVYRLAGTGLLYQIKVIDLGDDEARAIAAYAAITEALLLANETSPSGVSVSCQEENTLDLPVTERDQTFQQIGGNWRFWVDRP